MAMALLGLVLVSVGTALFTARVARANAVADAELSASRLSQYLVAPILADALAGVPGRFDELQRRIENRLEDRSLQAVFVWTAAGEVVFCSDPSVIGRTVRPSAHLLGAVHGTMWSGLDGGADVHFAGERPGPLVEVYVPLVLEGRPLAFETYFDASNIDGDAARLRARILPIALGALFLLQLVQVPVAVSLARRARRQDIERTALMARTLAVSEREREAIAADVRKGPVQELEAISRALTDLRAAVPPQRYGLLDRLTAAVGSAAGSLRRMIIDLYPRDPRVAALGATLEDLAAPLRAEGIEVTVQYAPLPELSPETAAAIYRTAKEALTNVSRHAGAEHVWVSLEPAGDPRAPAVRLCIDDDGLGFPATLLDRRQEGHLGLRLVADRANDAGGTLELGERPGGGASLTVCFPAAPPS